jgi:hypothetical protein
MPAADDISVTRRFVKKTRPKWSQFRPKCPEKLMVKIWEFKGKK